MEALDDSRIDTVIAQMQRLGCPIDTSSDLSELVDLPMDRRLAVFESDCDLAPAGSAGAGLYVFLGADDQIEYVTASHLQRDANGAADFVPISVAADGLIRDDLRSWYSNLVGQMRLGLARVDSGSASPTETIWNIAPSLQPQGEGSACMQCESEYITAVNGALAVSLEMGTELPWEHRKNVFTSANNACAARGSCSSAAGCLFNDAHTYLNDEFVDPSDLGRGMGCADESGELPTTTSCTVVGCDPELGPCSCSEADQGEGKCVCTTTTYEYCTANQEGIYQCCESLDANNCLPNYTAPGADSAVYDTQYFEYMPVFDPSPAEIANGQGGCELGARRCYKPSDEEKKYFGDFDTATQICSSHHANINCDGDTWCWQIESLGTCRVAGED